MLPQWAPIQPIRRVLSLKVVLLSVSLLFIGFTVSRLSPLYREDYQRHDTDTLAISVSEDEDQKQAGSVTFTNPRTAHDQIYIRSAFLVSDVEIRLSILRSYKNIANLTFQLGDLTGPVKAVCNLNTCRNTYSPECVITGVIGFVHLNRTIGDLDVLPLTVIRADEPSSTVDVPLTDVRPKAPTHKLGVCVQPIFLHAEVAVFVQFFEHWINHGATKFYIYQQSYSKDVTTLLQFYAAQPHLDVEFVNWSILPFSYKGNTGNTSADPNLLVFRTEVYMSVFDCLHRARHTAEYVAQMDLDEVVIVLEKEGLVTYLDRLSAQKPYMAAISVQSRRGAIVNYTWSDLEDLRNFTFQPFHHITAENYYFPRPAYSKLIHKPERTLNGHHHILTNGELLPLSLRTDRTRPSSRGVLPLRYRQIDVSRASLYILHLRRSMDNMFRARPLRPVDILNEQASNWERQFAQRIAASADDLRMRSGVDTLLRVEKCRKQLNLNMAKKCGSIWECTRGLDTTDWFYAPNSWYTL